MTKKVFICICIIQQETTFDPISLSCSHIFCYMCACSVASVNIVDGLKAAHPKSKCPICRQVSSYIVGRTELIAISVQICIIVSLKL